MNILHLSDIHFGRDNPEYGIKEPFKKHDQILEELIQCVKCLDEMSRPEHIVFTGDIAWHGTAEEFAEAYEWFSKLLNALNLTGKDISFCVGNHDVDWAYRCIDDKITDNSISDISKLYMYENISLLEPSIFAYNNFCKHIGMTPYAYPLEGKKHYSYSVGYKDVLFENKKKIRLIALNTAMLIAQPYISEDKMWLGQEQIKALADYGILPPDEDDDISYSIALYHHSDRFLHPNETSAYDGRCATLPLIQNYADLLLCGHTESTGRPRLLKQLGGGTILSGGACYYNDEHYNAFSLIYLDDKVKGIGFFPFYYDNGWKDYDFMEHSLFKGTVKKLEKENENIKSSKLIISDGKNEYLIPIGITDIFYENDDLIGFDNIDDFMNYFHISFKKSSENNLIVELHDSWADFIEAISKYDDFISFLNKSKDSELSWKLVDKNNNELISGKGRPDTKEVKVERELFEKLRSIEFYFGIRIHIPKVITELEQRKIDVLMDFISKDYTDKVTSDSIINEEVSLENMRKLYDKVKDDDVVYLRCRAKYKIDLFNVVLNIGEVFAIAGPYYVDKEDLLNKINTYCDGDRRFINFIGSENLNNYAILNYDRFANDQHDSVLSDLFDVNLFNFKIDV